MEEEKLVVDSEKFRQIVNECGVKEVQEILIESPYIEIYTGNHPELGEVLLFGICDGKNVVLKIGKGEQ